jgi:1,4-alpha-glucan branching enzyme
MIKQSRDRASGARRITFVLPADRPGGRVSVVGTFNDWTPGAHELRKRSNGTRSVSVTVAAGETICFRYLGENGSWFDDPDADAVTDAGGILTA